MGFPERLKELRKRGNLTQAQAAAALGVSESTIRKWESDSNSPSFEMLIHVANVTGASTDYLVGRPDVEFTGAPKWAIEPRAGAGRRRARRPTSEDQQAVRDAHAVEDPDGLPGSQPSDGIAS